MRNILKTVLPVLLFALLLFSSAGCGMLPYYVHARPVSPIITEKLEVDEGVTLYIFEFEDARADKTSVGGVKSRFGHYAQPIRLDGPIENAFSKSAINTLLEAGANAILVSAQDQQTRDMKSGVIVRGRVKEIFAEYEQITTIDMMSANGLARVTIELDLINNGSQHSLGPIVGTAKRRLSATSMMVGLSEVLDEAMANCFSEMIRELNRSKALAP